jgi:hypothetical protein
MRFLAALSVLLIAAFVVFTVVGGARWYRNRVTRELRETRKVRDRAVDTLTEVKQCLVQIPFDDGLVNEAMIKIYDFDDYYYQVQRGIER